MKTKIQIKSIFGKLLFEFETENNTIAKTLNEAIKSSTDLCFANLSHANLRDTNLSGANLSCANLYFANLSHANLRDTNLSGTNLSYANLRDTNLSGANLSCANLSCAHLNKRYIQVSCIGNSKRMTTYCFDNDTIWCGCFKGTLEEFEKRVIETHANNNQYLKEYLGFINYIKSLK